MKENILFLCTGDADGCKKTHCYKNGGECMYTQEVKYAKNFEERFGGFVEKETRQEVEQLNSVLKKNVQILKKIKLSMRKK